LKKYDHYFTAQIYFYTQENWIKEIKLLVQPKNFLVEQFLTEAAIPAGFGIDALLDFSSLPYPVRNFLTLFKNYQLNVLGKEDPFSLRITPPVENLFFEKTISFQPEIFLLEKKQRLSFLENYYSLEVDFHPETSELSLKKKDGIYLLQGDSQDFVLNHQHIQPLFSFLDRHLLREIFEKGAVYADYEIKNALFNQKNPSEQLKKFIFIPELKEFENEKIVFYFSRPEKDNFEIQAYFEFLYGERQVEYPFDFKEMRKSLLLREDIHIPFKPEIIITCRADSPFYGKISDLIQALESHFFEFLKEFDRNKIITRDGESLFQKFLPVVSPYVEIRSRDSEFRFIHGDFDKKEIEFLPPDVNRSVSIDWLEVRFHYKIQDITLTLNEVLHLLKNSFIQRDKEMISVSEDEIEALKDYLSQIRFKKEQEKYYIAKHQIPFMLGKEIKFLFPQKLKKFEEEIKAITLSKKALQKVEIPDHLGKILRDYQKTGVYWLSFLHRTGFGGILADEMGLGKTIQVLTFLRTIREKGAFLIVCPPALLYNWAAEIHKFFGVEFSFLIIDGNKNERKKKIKTIINYDIALTSYQAVSLDEEDYQDIVFQYCILDEAQHIKNKDAKRTQGVKKVKAFNRIAITGTPIENNIGELWSIFDFVMPDFLGNHAHFKKQIENPLQSFDIQERNKAMDKLKTAVKPFILRRTKANVLKELPPKIEQNIELEMTEKQKALYLETLSRIKNHYFETVQVKGLEKTAIEFLAALTKLRQLCLHPALLYPEWEGQEEASIKMKAFLELLYESIDSGHRVVVFSQFVGMLKIIRRELLKEKIEYFYIDGQTKNRVELVQRFNDSDVPVFLVSLKAGGIGLNLIGADSVILFDPWWNPAVENQAIDRVHRIGQKNVVHVYRLLTKGTIEEKIIKLQSHKKDIFENLVSSSQNFVKNMRWEDIEELFKA
jgi:SNF2 family DNA or RNA helicase